MTTNPCRRLSDADWNQLMTLTAGYLSIEGGDVKAAMQRALTAHAQLLHALQDGSLTASVARGQVTMFSPETGGVALRLERVVAPATEDAP